MSNSENCCCHFKNTPRSDETSRQLRNRINRIIGQLNGIQKMLDDNRYCGDIINQISAVESALQSIGYIILEEHMQTCVIEEVKKGNNNIVSEAVELMKKLK
ncbi:MAG: metal-sensing transcriptional repressor [Ruminococcus sp.]|nr:metal-sensing transcriptional repressor [Ruminococcus sp.]MDE7104748.1 metal-sensing transcriptional repressor [Ruminococcus sp.]